MPIPFRYISCIGVTMLASPLFGADDLSYELDSSYSYVGSATTNLGSFANGKTAEASEQSGSFRFVISPQLTEGVLLRVGTEWRRYCFGFPAETPLPDTLQSASLVLGTDMQVGESWLVRIEATPGYYGSFKGLTDKDFDVPFVIGGSYIASPDLQWILGIEVDINNRFPVLPGAGVRWKFAEKWVFNGILPTPRLEYSYSKALTLFAGADVQMSTYHVDDDFGTTHGRPALNSALVDYTEVRTGVGVSWKIYRNITAELEGGCMPYRDFRFYRADVDVKTSDVVPYEQIAIRGRF